MNTTLTLDKAGRVVLPKPVRDELQLSPGDSLEVETSEDQIVLRPVRGTSRLRKKQGIWVLDVDEPLSAETVTRTLQNIRRQREQSWLGREEITRPDASAKTTKKRP